MLLLDDMDAIFSAANVRARFYILPLIFQVANTAFCDLFSKDDTSSIVAGSDSTLRLTQYVHDALECFKSRHLEGRTALGSWPATVVVTCSETSSILQSLRDPGFLDFDVELSNPGELFWLVYI